MDVTHIKTIIHQHTLLLSLRFVLIGFYIRFFKRNPNWVVLLYLAKNAFKLGLNCNFVAYSQIVPHTFRRESNRRVPVYAQPEDM